ncbi:MAG TPA: glycoside hydrolase family 2 [Firmicutes bacterium]|jgi:beta-galactosidase/beta-glucuronidase|nr:glycoside hydrolase family 2 [Bacillota bacterium]
MTILRNEYPRPEFVRQDWLTLNGEWLFEFDDRNCGLVEDWINKQRNFTKKIIVPFSFQSKLSGIGDPAIHRVIWYRREFEVPSAWLGRQIKLNFGAVDYFTSVWVNGKFIGANQGGYVPFSFDITDYLIKGENQLVIRIFDDETPNHPRGKQTAKKETWACWYTRVSGIWQSVWLEPVAKNHLKTIKILPDLDQGEVAIRFQLSNCTENTRIQFKVLFKGEKVSEAETSINREFGYFADSVSMPEQVFKLTIPDIQPWSPENPNLYDLEIRIKEAEQAVDEVRTYFGMRKISVERGRICLNNKPYYLRMVLDQGIWNDGLYTPNSINELKKDVEMTKAFGFNGARKHQKIEDPYYYYFCDKLGLLVWSEMPSCYGFDETMIQSSTAEWQRAINRDYSHPCIMAWVPVNESWGVVQLLNSVNSEVYRRVVAYLETMYHLTKSLDDSRLAISNDGWQHAATDVITIHDYSQDAEELAGNYGHFKEDRHAASFLAGLPIILPGYEYQGQPIMISEFGGVKVIEQGSFGWGYGDAASTYPEMGERIQKLIRTIQTEAEICGYCYTQLTDTEQEVNGLMNAQRVPKLATNKFAEIFSAK